MFFAGSSNQYPKKPLAEKVFTTIKMIGNWLMSLKSKEEKTLNWILSASFLLHCIDGNSCFRYWNEFFSCVSGFRLKFPHIALLRKRLKMDSKSNFTTNGLILKFLVGNWFFVDFISARTEICMIAQVCFSFDEIKSF